MSKTSGMTEQEKLDKRKQLKGLLGDWPAGGSIQSTVLSAGEQAGYHLETLLLDLNGLEPVTAYLAKPLQKREEGPGRVPLVIYNHSHGGNYTVGRKELLTGSAYLQEPSFVKVLTDMGFAVCCIDMWGFHERGGRTESELFKEMLWQGQVLWGMMLFDTLRLVDYMAGREDIDGGRIGMIGMSMGGLMAWWAAALDDRIKVVVDLCAQVDAGTLIARRGLDHHGLYSYVPGLLKHFSTLDIQRLIVPRPRMSLTGRSDRLCPIEGVELLAEGLARSYRDAGVPENWQPVITSGGHMETAEMRAAWLPFLKRELQKV